MIVVDDLMVDESAHTVSRNGAQIDVTPDELFLLAALARHPDRSLDAEVLTDRLWGVGAAAPDAFASLLAGLRRKLEAHGPQIVFMNGRHGCVLRPAAPLPTTATEEALGRARDELASALDPISPASVDRAKRLLRARSVHQMLLLDGSRDRSERRSDLDLPEEDVARLAQDYAVASPSPPDLARQVPPPKEHRDSKPEPTAVTTRTETPTARSGLKVDEFDVQGNVLFGYRFRTARFCFFEFTAGPAARTWLRTHLLDDGLPTPGTWTEEGLGERAVNVALTYGGLDALGVAPAALATFPDDFRQGMYRRLGPNLREPEAVGHWERHWYRHRDGDPVGASPRGPTDGEVHLLVSVYGDQPVASELTDRLIDLADRPGSGLRPLGVTESRVHLPEGKRNVEHFGFVDGLSQPYLDGVTYRSARGARQRVEGSGALIRQRNGRQLWRPLQPGEFILGYPDEDRANPPLPHPVPLVRSGSYLVYRRLRQDIDEFAAFGREHPWPAGKEVAARLVGRHPDGRPLLPTSGGDPSHNSFAYGNDPFGYSSPLGSHIRRANPRDSLDLDPRIVNRHRIIRRIMPYGPVHTGSPDDRDRGIVFLAYCASISRQFEFVQREQLDNASMFGHDDTRDVHAGQAPASTIQHSESPATPDAVGTVQPTGGEYFFQPGRRALAGLVSGDFSDI